MSAATPRRRFRPVAFLGRALLLLTGLALVPVVLLVVLLAALQSEWVRGETTRLVTALVPGVELAELGPGLPFDLALGRVRLADDEGVWLDVEAVRLRVDPWALLDGTIRVPEVSAGLIHLHRLPPGADDPAPPEPPSDEPFALPDDIPAFALERLELRRVRLEAPVTGEAFELAITGSAASPDGRTVTANLDVRRLDAAGLAATLDATVDLGARTARLDLDASEASGLLARLSDDAVPGPVTLRVTGDGALAAWPVRLDASAEDLAAAELDLVLGLDGAMRLEARGRVTPGAGLVDGPLADLVGDGIVLDVALLPTADGADLERLDLRTDWLVLDGTGALAGETVRARIDAAIDDLAPLRPFVDETLAGSLRLAVDVDGSLPLPAGTLTLDVANLALADLDVAAVRQTLRFEPLAEDAIGFDLDGRIDGLRYTLPDAVFADDVVLEARGSVVPGGALNVETLRVAMAALTLDATAAGDLATGDLAADATLDVGDLAVLAPVLDPPPSGALRLEARARLADDFETGTVEVDLAGRNLGGLPPPASALVGSAPTLTLRAERTGAMAFRLLALDLQGSNLDLSATGEADLDDGPLDLRASLRVPDLAPVGVELEQDLAGSLVAEVNATGTLAAPDGALTLRLDGLEVGGQDLDLLLVEATVGGTPDDLAGTVAITADKAAGQLRLATPFRFQPERLRLEAIELTAPGLALEGALAANLQATTVTGRLAGGSPDLRPLGTWLGEPLAGRLDLAVDLDAPDGRQDARARLEARNLAAQGATVQAVTVRADAQDLMGALALDAAIDVTGVVQDELRVEQARVTARGTLAAMALDFSANGGLPDPFDVTGAGRFAQTDGVTTASLTALEGDIAAVPMRLTRPATVRLDDGTIELDGLELEVDTARLDIRGSLTPNRVAASVRLADLDLRRLEPLGAPPLVGMVALDVDLAGTPQAPTVRGEVRLRGFALGADPSPVDLGVTLGFDLGGGRLTAAVVTGGLGDPPLRIDASVPARFALEPFVFDLPDPLPLDARITGTVLLERVADWLALDGQTVAGRLDADLAVGGTTAVPALTGRVAMAGGRVEDVVVGALLTDLTVDVRAEGDRLVIDRIGARDGAVGSFDLTGDVAFGGAAGVALDLALDMDRFEVPQSDEIMIETSGRATVAGTPEALDVFGRFTVNRGEIRIPEGGAAGFPTLEVIDAADPPPAVVVGDEVASRIDLDVVVDVPGRLFVRGRGLVSEWGGRIEVTGDASSPRVVGGIAYRRGQLDLLGRRFEFRRGEVTLDGAFPPDPTLDIETTVQLTDVLAVLSISGPALDPTITATSEPPLPEDEVLSRLIFDRGTERLNAVQAVRLAMAVETLRGGGGGGFLEGTRSLLGLDTIDVAGESADDASIRAGIYVTDGIFLQLEQGLAPGSGSARVEIELTPRIKVETEVREDQTSSVGLRWSYDY